LLHLADARPQNQQRNERRRRQIARERYERLEKRFDRLVRAHRNAERDSQDCREDEPADDAPDRDSDVFRKAVLREERVSLLDHRDGIGEERLRHEAAESGNAPCRDEQRKKSEPERQLARRRNRFEWRHYALSSQANARDLFLQSLRSRSLATLGMTNERASLDEARIDDRAGI